MSYPTVALAFVTIFTTISVTAGFAQTATPQAAPPPDEPKSIVDRLKEPDQAGGLHFTEHWAVAFGGIKQGSGAGAGPAWSTKFADGGFVQLKAVISIRNFRLLQARYDTRRFWNERAIVVSRLRWHDAPAVKLYRLGPDSPDRHVDYAERRTEASSQLVFTVRPSLRAAGGFGVERFRTRADHLSELFDPEELALQAPPPGLGAHPVFAHAFARLGYDTRLSPDYTRDGRFVEGEIHVYRDVHGVEDAFVRARFTATSSWRWGTTSSAAPPARPCSTPNCSSRAAWSVARSVRNRSLASGGEPDVEDDAFAAVGDIGAYETHLLGVETDAKGDRLRDVVEAQSADVGRHLARLVRRGEIDELVNGPAILREIEDRVPIAEAVGRIRAQQVATAERGREIKRYRPLPFGE